MRLVLVDLFAFDFAFDLDLALVLCLGLGFESPDRKYQTAPIATPARSIFVKLPPADAVLAGDAGDAGDGPTSLLPFSGCTVISPFGLDTITTLGPPANGAGTAPAMTGDLLETAGMLRTIPGVRLQ